MLAGGRGSGKRAQLQSAKFRAGLRIPLLFSVGELIGGRGRGDSLFLSPCKQVDGRDRGRDTGGVSQEPERVVLVSVMPRARAV